MVDPVQGAGGDAIKKITEVTGEAAGKQEGPAKSGPSKFDQVMKNQKADPAQEIEAQRKVLETNVETQIQQVSKTEETQIRQEFDNTVSKMDRPEQVRYFAVRIRESKEAFLQLKSQSSNVESSPWKDKMVARLDEFDVEYGKIESVLGELGSGKEMSQQDLLALQIRSHKISQSVEVLSKAVEHTVGGMKTIFQTSV